MQLVLFKTDIRRYSFQIFFGEFFIELQLIQILYFSFLPAILDDGFCLVKVYIRMVAKSLYADPVQIDASDLRRRNGEPCLQLAIIQMNLLQLLYSVEAA